MKAEGSGSNERGRAPTSADTLARQIDAVIEQGLFSLSFQPIIDLETGAIAGCEVLTRPSECSGFAGPLPLFMGASTCNRLEELERTIRRRIIREAPEWSATSQLFVNNSPLVFTSEGYIQSLLDDLNASERLSPRNIVLEVTEQSSGIAEEDIGERARSLRALGFQVAIDDVGAGVSGLNQITNIRPDWIKLDRALIVDIDRDPFKQNLIRFFVRFTRFGGMSLIAEGIERMEELEALIQLGVRYAQGFALGRPSAQQPELSPPLRGAIQDMQDAYHERRLFDAGAVRVSTLAESAIVVDCGDPACDVWEKVSHQLRNSGAVVFSGRRFGGWIERDELEQHAHSVQPVGELSVLPAGKVSEDTTLAEALEVVAQLERTAQMAPLIVQQGSEIIGAVPLRTLLMTAARWQRRSTSIVSPLHGLPTRMEADRWIARAIEERRNIDVAFIDLRDFGAYNVGYGTDMGDEMLRRFAGMLRDSMTTLNDPAGFLAHLGEDRFMMATGRGLETVLQNVIRSFRQMQGEFYTVEDVERHAFSYGLADGSTEDRSLVRPRLVCLAAPFTTDPPIRSPYEIYQRVRHLRMAEVPGDVIHERRRRSRGGQAASA